MCNKKFLTYEEQIEQNIKSTLSYEFCNEYGENQKEYLSQENYFITNKNKSEINKLIILLSDLINKNDYPFITYNKDKYNNIPLWILMHAVTFGQLSKMYSYQKNIIKIKVSQNFIDVLPKNLENYLNILTKFRNVAAHGERFYCFKTKTDIQDTTIHKKLKIPKKNGKYTKGKNDLFSIIIIFYYLLTHEDFLTFCEQLEKILLLGEKALSHIKNKNILELMGIPQNWTEFKKMKNDTKI